ncbi:MAG: PIN domain-containing protein [Candidatus Thermoplasmatota archaeon]|nr:PIN domain-containing protein [Candidatus Thermoplasmatota archaeon]
MIADTTFLIDLMRDDESAVKKETMLEENGTSVYITTVSVFELYVGLNLSNKRIHESMKIERVLRNLQILGLDFESAKEAGEIYAYKRRSGIVIDPEDAMIAGICRTARQPILTRNINHFSGIEGVSLESY